MVANLFSVEFFTRRHLPLVCFPKDGIQRSATLQNRWIVKLCLNVKLQDKFHPFDGIWRVGGLFYQSTLGHIVLAHVQSANIVMEVCWRGTLSDIMKLTFHEGAKHLSTHLANRCRDNLIFVRHNETCIVMSIWVHFQIVFTIASHEFFVLSIVVQVLDKSLLLGGNEFWNLPIVLQIWRGNILNFLFLFRV